MAHSQVLTEDEVKDKTEQKVDQRIDRRVDRALDKGLDGIENAIFGRRSKRSNDGGNTGDSEPDATDQDTERPATAPSIFSKSDANLEDAYSFEAESVVELTSRDKKGKEEIMEMNILFSKNQNLFAFEMSEAAGNGQSGTSITIFDMANEQMIALMDASGQKMAMVMPLQPNPEEEDDGDDSDVSVVKTGRTKDILGYECEEYAITSDDGTGTVWVTQDADLSTGLAMNSFGAQGSRHKNGPSMSMPAKMPEGAIMEMHFENKDGSQMDWITKEINLNLNRTYNTAGFQVMNLGGRGR
ncbi:MAG: hypothetical protein Kow0075_14970 [Salibacteraceae bacterium]